MSYLVNEVFVSPQGEGALAGTPMLFVRFSKCNLSCAGGAIEGGGMQPVCDTEFESGRRIGVEELFEWAEVVRDGLPQPAWALLTGGEPLLQVDPPLIEELKSRGLSVALETNGTIPLEARQLDDRSFDHITLSPKIAEHAIRLEFAHELRYVRAYGQGIPKPAIEKRMHDRFKQTPRWRYLSPHFGEGFLLDQRNIEWCIQLAKENPGWAVSVQLHKIWGER